jgi:hypothetical protein
VREDIDELCENMAVTSEKPLSKEIQDMHVLMRNQEEKLQALCKDSLQDLPHGTIQQYLKTFALRISPLNPENTKIPNEMFSEQANGFLNENEPLNELFNQDGFNINSLRKELKIQSGSLPRSMGSVLSLNETGEGGSKEESFEAFCSNFKDNGKFYWRDFHDTPSTTPNTSKRNSPFNEKKNLLLSSKIEDILNEGDEIYCQKFDEENISIENGLEEKQMNFDFFLKGQDNVSFEKPEEEFGSMRKINESLILADNDNLPFF